MERIQYFIEQELFIKSDKKGRPVMRSCIDQPARSKATVPSTIAPPTMATTRTTKPTSFPTTSTPWVGGLVAIAIPPSIGILARHKKFALGLPSLYNRNPP